jgi:hypothetical protein
MTRVRLSARGFSLVEILFALSLFLFGVLAATALVMHNLKTTRSAKNNAVLAYLKAEIPARCQVAAWLAFEATSPLRPQPSTFQTSAWLPLDPAVVDDPGGMDREGTPAAEVFDRQAWGEVKARFDRLGGPEGAWDAQPMLQGFQFRLRTVTPSAEEAAQFTDWDGYGEIGESEADADLDGDGALNSEEVKRDFGAPRPSHGVYFDPRGLHRYLKHLECVVGWDLEDPSRIQSGQWETFRFSVYNPDLRKR